MTHQTAREWVPAIVVAMLLILTAWGNAIALLTASLLGLVVGTMVLRRERIQGGFLVAAVGCAVAVVAAVITLMI